MIGRVIAALLAASLAACAAPPPTPNATNDEPVPAPACPVVAIYNYFELVFFDPNSAALTPRAKQVLTASAARWQQHGGKAYKMSAHTDAAEARTRHRSLATERASSVKAYLVSQGIPPEVITFVPYGASRPLVPSDAPEAQNRRVELGGQYDESAASELRRSECKSWVIDHCFTPTRLQQASPAACRAALDSALRSSN